MAIDKKELTIITLVLSPSGRLSRISDPTRKKGNITLGKEFLNHTQGGQALTGRK